MQHHYKMISARAAVVSFKGRYRGYRAKKDQSCGSYFVTQVVVEATTSDFVTICYGESWDSSGQRTNES